MHVQCFTPFFFSVRFLRGVYLSESSVGENWDQDGRRLTVNYATSNEEESERFAMVMMAGISMATGVSQ